MHVRNVSPSARFSVLVSLILSFMTTAMATAASGPSPSMRAAWTRLPLQFEANVGQVDPEVRYLSHGRNFSLFLTSTEAVLVFGPAPNVLRMSVEGANAQSHVAAVEELAGKVNYFIGSDRRKWHTGVATFGKVRYEDVYPGIDLIYRGNGSELEYDFVVSPGADPRAIALRFSGADALCVDRDGTLLLDRGDGQLRVRRPLVYQEVDGRRIEIAGGFRIVGPDEVGFVLGSYDEGRDLIVDPALEYSTYLGGTGFDQAQAIALDAAGNAYLTGFTGSEDFPLLNPYQTVRGPGEAAFVSKLDASGTALVYSTYLGGNDNNAGFGIAVDAAGEAVVVGQTSASDFPTVNAVQPTYGGVLDGFVTKLAADGASLIYSTYLGGTGGDESTAVAVDAAGNAYVAGGSNDTDFPTLNPIHVPTESTLPDVVVSKLSPSGSLIYSTYLGGSLGDTALGIAVDATGAAYVGGQTESTDFPVTAGVFQSSFAGGGLAGFVLKLNPAGSAIVYSTYVGGSLFDEVNGIAVTAGGEAWVTGVTNSSQFPTLQPLQAASTGLPDAFVTKLSTTGSGLFSTYLGGSALDSGIGIGLDASGNAYVTGIVDSADFPVVDALQPTLGGPEDAYVTEISSTGSRIVYSTFLGGSSDDEGIALAVDATGRVVVTGRTNSNDFPTLNPAQADNAGGFGDAFVTRISAAPNITDLDLFLRLGGHPPATQLLEAPPDARGYTSRDSGAVKFAGGNAWATVASWKATPTPTGTLASLGPLNAWIGLKNAADAGTNFDVLAQVFHNGVLVSEGMTRCVQNLGHPPGSMEITVPIDPFPPVPLAASDDLALTISARIGTDAGGGPCGGPQSAKGLRVYFDAAQQASRLTLGLAP